MMNNSSRRRELIIVLLLVLGLGVLLSVTYGRARESKRLSYCQSNLKQLGLAYMQYTRDYDEIFPPAAKWTDVLPPYHKSVALYFCPSALGHGFAMNRYFDGVSMARMNQPQQEPLLFDSTLGKPNAFDVGESLPVPGRHQEGNNVLFADGHVKLMKTAPQFKPLPLLQPTPLPTRPAKR